MLRDDALGVDGSGDLDVDRSQKTRVAMHNPNGPEDGRRTLNPSEIAKLFRFPPNLQEKVSKATKRTPPSERLVEDHGSNLSDVDLMKPERERTNIMESIRSLDLKIGNIEDKKREISNELENLLHLESFSRSTRKNYVKMLIETDNAIYRNLGIESEGEKTGEGRTEPAYPTRGVFAIGLLIALIGVMILMPIQVPTNLKLVFGPGLLLVGLSVQISSILQLRGKSKRAKGHDLKPG